jgi:hypothetical protein
MTATLTCGFFKEKIMRINRQDSILRRSWVGNLTSGPADATFANFNSTIASLEADGCQGGFSYGRLVESPEHDGIRFHSPKWISDIDLFAKYSQRLLKARTKRFPSLAKFEASKTEVDSKILWSYFVDHMAYEEIYATFSRRKVADETYGVCDISTGDAKSLEEAVELAAKINGTVSFYDEDANSFTYVDQTASPGDPKFFKTIKARKINATTYRVVFNVDDGDTYYLSKKLAPKNGSTRNIQRYIADLVDEGYELMKMSKPTKAQREAASKARKAQEARAIGHTQIGRGTNPKIYEDSDDDEGLIARKGRSQSSIEHIEHKRLAVLENRLRKPEDPETAYQGLVDVMGADRAKARFVQTLPWQPPAELLAELGAESGVIEFKPAAPTVSPAFRVAA